MSSIKRGLKTMPRHLLGRFSLFLFVALLVTAANLVSPVRQVVEAQANCTPVVVPGTSDIYLAGQPAGTTADRTDVAPAQSPVLANGSITAGATLSFTSITGTVTHGPNDGCCSTTGPEGGFITGHDIGAQNGISNVIAPVNSLIGVFLGPAIPAGAVPATLDFSSAASRDYLTLSPQLRQVFFIGNGLTSAAVLQQVIAPAGATRLFLGTMDGYDSNNNLGSFSVTVCIVPCVNPPNITVSNTAGQCGANVSFPPGSGACALATCTPASGSFFPVGSTSVTCSTTGGGSVTFTVTVNDTQPPTITCPANFTTTNTTVTFPNPAISDNCPGATVTCVPPSGSTFPAGATTVNCTAKDASNNTAGCSFVVTVDTGFICLEDDENIINIIRVNLTTGEYMFVSCQNFALNGQGIVKKKGCSVTVEDIRSDRRVQIQVDICLRRGTAAVQSFTVNKTFPITDRNIDNNPCVCPAPF
ncbi:MAG TPA: HYR domain-containing protein [Blastocatellia bacterium]|nr:HYR domain-containing protein [Blastocatellia bacterium]